MVLLDTHAILWWFGRSRFLSARAARAIGQASRVLVSPVSFWEVAILVRKKKLVLDRGVFEWVADFVAGERIDIAPLTPSAAAGAGMLGDAFTGDPADRFLYATARELAVPLITRDRAIRSFARASRDVRTIW